MISTITFRLVFIQWKNIQLLISTFNFFQNHKTTAKKLLDRLFYEHKNFPKDWEKWQQQQFRDFEDMFFKSRHQLNLNSWLENQSVVCRKDALLLFFCVILHLQKKYSPVCSHKLCLLGINKSKKKSVEWQTVSFIELMKFSY